MVNHSRRKAKGTNAERELVHIFWQHGWAASRMAGSGSITIPSPDIIAGKNRELYVIECKTVDKLPKYFSIKEISDLELFAHRIGAKPVVAVKVSRKGWFFLESRFLRKTQKSFIMDQSIKEIKKLDEFI